MMRMLGRNLGMGGGMKPFNSRHYGNMADGGGFFPPGMLPGGGASHTGHMMNLQPGGVLPQVPLSQSQYGMYPPKGSNDSFKNFDNISNGVHGNASASPLGYADAQGSPAKGGANQGQRGRLLEPLFG